MARQYYDDDNPPHRRFETRDQARDRANDLIDNLNKSKDDAHRKLAQKLDTCSSDHPCYSGACPRCLRTARPHWIGAIVDLVENEWSRP